RLAELEAAGRRAALATVVDIVGSAYRRPGAKLLIEAAGGTLGSVSGGCLEADVREVAAELLARGAGGQPALRPDHTGDEGWGWALGCSGLVDVFVQPATEGPLAALSAPLRELFAGDSAVVLATLLAAGEQEQQEEEAGATLAFSMSSPAMPAALGTLGSADL